MFLTRISVGQPVFATMVMIALMVVGAFSYSRLPVEQFPDVDFPVVAVVTSYPGATPEAVESDIIEPIEDSVSTLALNAEHALQAIGNRHVEVSELLHHDGQ